MQKLQSYKLSHLLPFDMNTLEQNQNLQNQLRIYETIINLAIDSCNYWHKKNYSLFDALVSENACQIRAFWIISNALKKLIKTDILKDKLLATLEIITALPKNDSLYSLGQLIELENLEMELTRDEIFLILSHILYRMRAKTPKDNNEISLFMADKTDCKCFLPQIKKNKAERLNHKSKVLLSKLSVEYIEEKGLFDNRERYSILKPKEKDELAIYPMFWTYEILLNLARKEGIPLLLYTKFTSKSSNNKFQKIDEEIVLFESKNSIYERCPIEFSSERPVCVIEGITVNEAISKEKWITDVEKYGILKIILAGAAHHRQFPDSKLDEEFDQEIYQNIAYEYKKYKELADEIGCSCNYPHFFFIQHVYPHILNRVPIIVQKITEVKKE